MIAESTDDFFLIENFFIDKEKISLDDRIFVTKNFRIDTVLLNYYGLQFGMKYLPLVLSFNGIRDITNIELDSVFEVPNLESLLSNTRTLSKNDVTVGIVSNIPTLKSGNIKQQPPSTTKLKLKQTPVTYNKSEGTITY